MYQYNHIKYETDKKEYSLFENKSIFDIKNDSAFKILKKKNNCIALFNLYIYYGIKTGFWNKWKRKKYLKLSALHSHPQAIFNIAVQNNNSSLLHYLSSIKELYEIRKESLVELIKIFSKKKDYNKANLYYNELYILKTDKEREDEKNKPYSTNITYYENSFSKKDREIAYIIIENIINETKFESDKKDYETYESIFHNYSMRFILRNEEYREKFIELLKNKNYYAFYMLSKYHGIHYKDDLTYKKLKLLIND